ncbi:aminotransferase class I/II-fold pyridoxal phosphate-dependent enzyme [Mesobacillus maritimus]|uniref:aminotransferase class I/II-fold pyridoxal phosphate-dependent enzyme n=1 Tax=Mesobacillus maritimus TaxID=1643336 RepID=UPI00203DF883|nr:aminotransferase class I/II-fold pyridoxal phosphate-dependent enzyme [Mesobacillus maritimus]MCM3671608.1 aminotransferase class I/II-fold pyridoxal phosphate-dependent enzyme [Mesobacillus maritimus]
MSQSQMPLLNRLIAHNNNHPLSFHVPGHKNGQLFQGNGRVYYESLLHLDATELTGLDDLHAPEGVIHSAEELLSELYGAGKSFFLVNGSTSGNLAMILATLKENDVVLVQRNSHKSIMNGIQLAKAHPVYIHPEYDDETMVASGVGLETVKEALKANPHAKALILTYPNYYGMVYNLQEIIKLAQDSQIPVLVDEAHGVHFVAGDPFPPSALELGADIVVQSAHKTLPAMTMGAFLHYNSKVISLSRVSYYLQVLQSSSPSYPIMGSLDFARSYLGTFTLEDKQYLLNQLTAFRKEVNNIEGLKVLWRKNEDPLKLVLQSTDGLSGYELQSLLESQGIYSELADPINVLLVLPMVKQDSPFPFNVAIERMKQAMIKTGNNLDGARHHPDYFHVFRGDSFSSLAVSYKEMEQMQQVGMSLDIAIGEICAETITPYPPGIPLLLPGERIQQFHISYIKRLLELGAKIQGGAQLINKKIKVLK